MKQICFRHLQSLVVVALCVVMAVAFNSCSSDDDEKSANDNLYSIVVGGTWAQDGDDDIMVIKADGTGIGYDNATDYKNNDIDFRFKWEYKNKWFYITDITCPRDDDDDYISEQREMMRVSFLSQDKIVWQRYDEEEDIDKDSEHDAFGYYHLWTWERETR